VTPPVLAVAHRAGNSRAALREAVALRADVIECDVHAHRGRLEVRHLKTAGPLPFLWDRWELVRASSVPLWALRDALDAEARGVTFMLDLKGPRTSAARAVAAALHEGAHHGPVLVCGRFWRTVDLLGELPYVLPVLSARSRLDLARLRRRLATSRREGQRPSPVFGVSVHLGLLEPDVVGELRREVARVMTWPVNDLATLDRVVRLGVNGVITDDAAVLSEVVRRNTAAEAP
jgi:glycerophosphoryl diester phosphodiesterase